MCGAVALVGAYEQSFDGLVQRFCRVGEGLFRTEITRDNRLVFDMFDAGPTKGLIVY